MRVFVCVCVNKIPISFPSSNFTVFGPHTFSSHQNKQILVTPLSAR